jgi:hypothetical protein
MPGPAPKPAGEKRRRNASPDTLKLPSEGRHGDTPEWPLKAVEPEFWEELWKTPHAVAWERLGWTRVVARYALVLEMCEVDGAPITAFSEARQMEDKLGLTPMSMKRLGWDISSDEVAEQRASKPVKPGARRLKVVAEEFRPAKVAE